MVLRSEKKKQTLEREKGSVVGISESGVIGREEKKRGRAGDS